MRRRSLLVTLALALLACGDADPSSPATHAESPEAGTDPGDSGSEGSSSTGTPVDADVTYYGDVAPIVNARCGACHEPGGAAPFALGTYEEVAGLAEAMLAVVIAKTMPPWPAGEGCRTYTHDPTLSDEQISTLQAWIDGGKAMGDPALVGEPIPREEVLLDRVDFTIGMSEGHVPTPTEGIDEHRCFLIDWPSEAPVYITGFETHPGNRAALHHFVGLIVGPERVADLQASDDADPAYGWACGAGTGMAGLGGELFATWVPGARATRMPEGTGLRVEPGSKILLNMHYNVLSGDLSPDQTMFDFQIEHEVERPGHAFFATDFKWVTQESMDIPAGEASVVHESAVSQVQFGSQPYTIHTLGLHMHTLGTRGRLFIERASGTEDCLLDIPEWDFDWQLGYELADPVHVGEGDALHIECEWDNSAANQPVIDGEPADPRDVNWGEDTFDEMCLGMVYVTID